MPGTFAGPCTGDPTGVRGRECIIQVGHRTESVASSGHVAGGPLEPGGVGQWEQQTAFVFRKSFTDTARQSPMRPGGVDLIECSREGEHQMPKDQTASGLFRNLQRRLKFRGEGAGLC